MPVGARRTQSLPSKHFMPSSSMGEYEAQRRRSAPAKPAGGLFPLDEEGTYGAPPLAPKPPPAAPKRERKPKVYSSYSVDSSCNIHAKKLQKVQEQRDREMNEQRARRRRSMNSRPRSHMSSASPSRASSEARSSKSPEPSMRRKSSGGSSSGGEYSRKLTPTTGPGYARDAYSVTQKYSTSSNSSSYKFSNINESDEYTYTENRRGSSSRFANGGLSNGMSGMSLDGLRKPKIDSWDSMGILGLSSKIWNDTKKNQENFMSSTGQFLREEHDSYIM